ncbi:hypothetical protein D3C81_2160620 [compost metagenome]
MPAYASTQAETVNSNMLMAITTKTIKIARPMTTPAILKAILLGHIDMLSTILPKISKPS